MGCQGSKAAQVSKPEQQSTSATLLQDPTTEQNTVKTEESIATTAPAENLATEVAAVASAEKVLPEQVQPENLALEPLPKISAYAEAASAENPAPVENPAEAVSTVAETDVANVGVSSAEKSGYFNWFKMLTFCTAETQAEIVAQIDETQTEILTQTDEPVFAQKEELDRSRPIWTEVMAQKNESQTEMAAATNEATVAQNDEAQPQDVAQEYKSETQTHVVADEYEAQTDVQVAPGVVAQKHEAQVYVLAAGRSSVVQRRLARSGASCATPKIVTSPITGSATPRQRHLSGSDDSLFTPRSPKSPTRSTSPKGKAHGLSLNRW